MVSIHSIINECVKATTMSETHVLFSRCQTDQRPASNMLRTSSAGCPFRADLYFSEIEIVLRIWHTYYPHENLNNRVLIDMHNTVTLLVAYTLGRSASGLRKIPFSCMHS